MVTKVRSRKLSTKVDLTAMVSISFLLIIFFMVTTELAKPKILALGLSGNSDCGGWGCSSGTEMRTMTILLGDNDKLVTYNGLLSSPLKVPKVVEYGRAGIRKELFTTNNQILEYSKQAGKPERGAIVIIKPSKKCSYKNLVDILDEMTITDIDTYAIVNDFTPEESKLLALK